ncbi:stage V sporulation protein AE [Sporohalobacter salinus]|uniref:stage V sporulation protein AE n=1 Tax=Sporohalobacter salinus TaxID=1494606 RepID=UPI0019616BBB|nr:stage V sporulation protein AE [Sporohalobacter salinus]MBM7623576.1 stage V sporulation protein AE [Sporohalobacter salinus]
MITDGDNTACRAVEEVGKKLGLRTISRSAGTPTDCSGKEIIELVKEAESDIALVMFDDEGDKNKSSGEEAMAGVLDSSEVEVLGILSVASDTKDVIGVKPDFSVTNQAQIVDGPVTKDGNPEPADHLYLEGDTVDVINEFNPQLIVGIGDIGKMEYQDDHKVGCPITTKAIKEILIRSGKNYEGDI